MILIVELNSSSLKYLWSTSTSTPSEGNITAPFTNGDILSISGLSGNYYLWVLAKDNAGNTEIKRSNVFKLDNTNPSISFGTNGNSSYAKSHSTTVSVSDTHSNVDASSLKYLWTQSTSTPSESSITTSFTNGGTINSPSGVTGDYYLWVLAKDIAGNTEIKRSNVFKLDNILPSISFGTNGNSTYKQTHSTTISVSDVHSGIKAGSLEYLWTTTASSPVGGSLKSFTNGSTINTPTGVTGNYYLWAFAEDIAGNKTVIRSEMFKLDNTNPVITINGPNPMDVNIGSTFVDPGATASDAHSGLDGEMVVSASVNVDVIGYYMVVYTVYDKAGNFSGAKVRNVRVIDNVPPIINLGTNGNSTYQKSHSTTIIATDQHGSIASKGYQWTTSSTFPTGGTWKDFAIGSSVTTPAGESGNYYLHIKATDNEGNTAKVTSNVFKLDNTVPNVDNINLTVSSVTHDGFVINRSGNASDSHSGLAAAPYEYQVIAVGGPTVSGCTNNSTSCNVSGLDDMISYYYRVCVKDKAGNQKCTSAKTVTTLESLIYDKIIDSRDGEIYNTIKIGNQWWFAENLRYVENGCLDASNTFEKCFDDYGGIFYRQEAVFGSDFYEGSKGICPTGWHIPTYNDWSNLINYAGGPNVGGKKLKSILYNGTNDYKFNAHLYGGYDFYYTLEEVGYNGYFWSSFFPGGTPAILTLNNVDDSVYLANGVTHLSGFNVRCVMDDNQQMIKDPRDSQSYRTVKIGDQWWFAENLKYTGNGCLNKTWTSNDNIADACRKNGGSGWDKDEIKYQWSATMNGSTANGAQGLCPAGWHIPTDTEWKILEGTVDSVYGIGNSIWNNTGYRGSDAGTQLKSTSIGGFDTYSFTGLFAGVRHYTSDLYLVDSEAYWWTSTAFDSSKAWYRNLYSVNNNINRSNDWRSSGASIRCIKDVIFIDSRDGQTYDLIKIGNQRWFAENLKYEGLDYGIPVSDSYYLFEHLCPPGSRVPTAYDWNELINYIGVDDSGKKLKSIYANGTDNYGFKALSNQENFNFYPLGEYNTRVDQYKTVLIDKNNDFVDIVPIYGHEDVFIRCIVE